jgi:hypothetical protein
MAAKTVRISDVVQRMKSWGSVRITACSKYEWGSERVRASRRVANTNEAQIDRRRATQRRGQVRENVSDETDFTKVHHVKCLTAVVR